MNKQKSCPENLEELHVYLLRRQKENDERAITTSDIDKARHEGKASAYGLAAQKLKYIMLKESK